jgi:hypothetical protein
MGQGGKPRAYHWVDVNKSLLSITNRVLELLFCEGRLFFASGVLSRDQKEKTSEISANHAKRVVKNE